MSFKALVEVMVHVDTFRNIDLFYQGIYFVKMKLYQRKKDTQVLSTKKLDKATSLNEESGFELEIAQPYCFFRSFI